MRDAIIYLLAITTAEVITTFTIEVQPVWGIACHFVILVATLLHPAIASEYRYRRLILSLALVPLIRIISLSVPLADIPLIWLYPIIYIPLLATALAVMRILGYRARDVGLTLRRFPVQLAVGLSGLLFGIAEYFILKQVLKQILEMEPLIDSLSWSEIWLPALIFLVCTGFGEEFIFRGVLQKTGTEAFGWRGLIYISLLFAVLHMGFRSWLDVVFVFAVALFFGWVVKKTGSLVGVTLSHGITNIVLFLIAPFFF